MRTSSRRKLDSALLVGGGVVVGVVALIGAAGGDTERVVDMYAQAQLDDTGAAQVNEVIDYNFGIAGATEEKHGILRVVPGLDPAAAITVTSPDAPADVETYVDPLGTGLRIGRADQTVSGRHRYTIDYPLAGMAQGTTVDWEVMGPYSEVGFDHVEVHLLAPYELLEPLCLEGDPGSPSVCDVRQVEPGHLVATIDGLSGRQGITVEAKAGSDLARAPGLVQVPAPEELPGTGLLPPAGTAAAAALVATIPAAWLVRRAGRERVAAGGAADAAYYAYAGGPQPPSAGPDAVLPPPPDGTPPSWSTPVSMPAPPPSAGDVRLDVKELGEMATTDFAPPENLSPPQGGIVLTESVRSEHKVAWLIDAAIDGAIDLQEEGDKVTGLVRTGQGDAETAPILDMAFGSRTQIALDEYDEEFAQAWGEVGNQLDTWHRTCGLWDHGADRRRVIVRVLGGLGVIFGLLLVVAGGALCTMKGGGWLPMVGVGGVLFGAGLAAALRGWELRVRTPAGSAAWLRVESFRRFLAGSEAYHAEEAARRGVLREYTAWAVALGEIDRWSRAVRASTAIPADAGISYAYLAPALMMSTMSASTAPSSSGSGGGFGGGSIGGGAGGGSVGSW
jgi:hypothetical protein